MEAAKKMEQGALQEYEQVSIDYCVLQTIEKTIALSNSKGLSLCHKNGIVANISTIAQQNGDVKTASEDWTSNDWSTFYPQEIGRKAGEKAVSHLGAYSLPSGEYRVLFGKSCSSRVAFCVCWYILWRKCTKRIFLF